MTLVLVLLVGCSDLKVDYGGEDPTTDGGTSDGGVADGGPADGGLADGGLADGGLADGGTATTGRATWSWGEDVPVSAADASFIGEASGDGAGSHLLAPGDVDGDGLADLVVSAANHDVVVDSELADGAGRLYIVHGAGDGWAPDLPLAGLPGAWGVERGSQVHSDQVLGDVSGDGLADIGAAIGVSVADPPGHPGVLLGESPPGEAVPLDALHWSAAAADGAPGHYEGVAGLGDVSGDDVADLLLTDSFARDLVVVFGGDLSGSAVLPDDADLHLATGEWEWTSLSTGDLTGDGRADVLVAVTPGGAQRLAALWSPGTSTATSGELLSDEAHTLFQASDGLVMGATILADVDGDGISEALLSGELRGTTEAWLVAGDSGLPATVVADEAGVKVFPGQGSVGPVVVGDVDGDGLADLLAERDGDGSTFVRETVLVPGQSGGWVGAIDDGSVVAALRLTSDDESSSSLPPADLRADLDGDGLGDLVLGAASHDHDGIENAGMVRVFRGRTDWPAVLDQAEADARFHGEAEDADVGRALAAVDLDGDGCDDLVTSSTSYPLASNQGQVFIFFGQPYSD